MKIKSVSLLIASLFISTPLLAADKSWTGFKIGVGIGGINAQSKDKTTSSHNFEDSGNFTTSDVEQNGENSDIPNYSNVGANAHDNLRNESLNSTSNLNAANLDLSAGVRDDSTSTFVGTQEDSTGYDAGTNIYNRNYSFSELFSGNGFSSNDLSKSNMFGTIEAGYDWQLTDRVVFGLNASFNLSSKNKAKGTGSGNNTANWTETYSYDSRTYTDNAVGAGGGGEAQQADLWTGAQKSNVANAYAPGNNGFQSSSTSVNSSVETGNSFDLGARIGFLATEDTLIFLSGGASAIKAKQNLTYSSHANLDGISEFGTDGDTNSYNFSRSSSKSDTRVGYYIGAGIETRLTANASLKMEYRYADYGKMTSRLNRNETLSDTGANVLEFYDSIGGSSSLKQESDITAHSFRAVLNYNF